MRIVETSHRTAEFDRRDLKMIAEGLAEAGIARRDVEPVRPVVNGIYPMDDGHILVGIIAVTPGALDVPYLVRATIRRPQ